MASRQSQQTVHNETSDPAGSREASSLLSRIAEFQSLDASATLSQTILSRGAVWDENAAPARMPTLTAQVDAKQRIRSVNNAGRIWFGKPPKEFTGHSLLELFGEEFHAILLPQITRVMAGETVEFESDSPLKLAASHLLRHQYLPLRDGRKRVSGFCMTITDASREESWGDSTLRGALNASAVGAWSWDLARNIIVCDDHMWKMFDLSTSNSARFLDSIHPDDTERLTQAVNRSISSGSAHEVNYRVISVEGRTARHLASRGSIVETRDGRPVRMAGVCFDITHRMRTEEELRRLNATLEYQRATALSLMRDAEEEMFRAAHAKEDVRRHQQFLDSIVENIPGMVFVKDAEELRFLHANRITEQVLGRIREELIGKTEYDLLPKEQADAVTHVEREVIRTRQEVDIPEQAVNTSDRGRRIMHTRKLPILDESGNPRYLLAISEDITDRKVAEEALAKERSLLRTVIDNLPDYIFAKDTQSRFILNNRAHAQLVGATFAVDVLGKSDHDIFPPELAVKYAEDDQKVMLEGESVLGKEEPMFDRLGGKRWLSTTKVPLKRPDGKIIGVVGLSRDVTEQKKAAERMERMMGELARSNSELEQFAYVASHDLQEPLRKIQAFSGRLRDRWGNQLGEQGTDYLNRVENAAARMQILIEDLLAYSRVTSKAKPFVRVNLSEVAEGVLSDLEARIERMNATVEVSELPSLAADPTQMRQLLQNLIGNALKFQRPDAQPVVKIYSQSVPAIDSDANSQPDFCQIFVEDNGIGFDPKHATKIFQVFQRLHTRNEYQGSGIGLAVCKKIIDRHGGKIDALGRPGEGATFVVTLPYSQVLDSEQYEEGTES